LQKRHKSMIQALYKNTIVINFSANFQNALPEKRGGGYVKLLTFLYIFLLQKKLTDLVFFK